ncbi:hypothetical protein KI387_031683, partial [Taxus chinensis]
TWFQNMVPIERILAMGSFEEGTYLRMKKTLSWVFESHIDELDFEVCQGMIIIVPESKGDNPLVNAQELSDEKVCNVLNKVMVKTEARLLACNDKIRVLEEKLGKKEEELAGEDPELEVGRDLISTQLRCELKEEKKK